MYQKDTVPLEKFKFKLIIKLIFFFVLVCIGRLSLSMTVM